MIDAPIVVSYGGGTNSTAMLCGFREKGIKPDLILFADTGAEMPHTYRHVDYMQERVRSWWGLDIIRVMGKRKGQPWTIVQDCQHRDALPSLAYGWRSCSVRFKHQPMEEYLCKWMKTRSLHGLVCCIGFHSEEAHRTNGKPKEKILKKGFKVSYWYPLIDWQWRQEDCRNAICRNGIPQPGKSACFFCPASKRSEVLRLAETAPELLKTALKIEETAQAKNRNKIGLGGPGNLWSDWLAMDESQSKLMLDIEPYEMPCNCMDE